ncbi:MAG: tetratricopeptide repeat protein [Mucinivorans sp.]
MKKIAFALVALFLSLNITFAQSLDDATAKYNSAVEKVKAKDYVAAIPLLKEAMNMAIDAGESGLDLTKSVQQILPVVHFQLGLDQYKSKKFDDALKSLKTAQETGDLYNNVKIARQASRAISGIYMAQGIDCFNNKDFAGALEIFKKGYAEDDGNVKLASFTAKTYAELGQLSEAVPLFEKVIQAGTDNSRYAKDSSEAYADMNNYVLVAISAAAEAKDIDKVIALADMAPTSPQAAILAMQVANNAKKYDIVIARGDKAAELQKDDALKSDVYYFVGSAYNDKANKPKAIEYLSKVTSGQFAADARTAVAELKK